MKASIGINLEVYKAIYLSEDVRLGIFFLKDRIGLEGIINRLLRNGIFVNKNTIKNFILGSFYNDDLLTNVGVIDETTIDKFVHYIYIVYKRIREARVEVNGFWCEINHLKFLSMTTEWLVLEIKISELK